MKVFPWSETTVIIPFLSIFRTFCILSFQSLFTQKYNNSWGAFHPIPSHSKGHFLQVISHSETTETTIPCANGINFLFLPIHSPPSVAPPFNPEGGASCSIRFRWWRSNYATFLSGRRISANYILFWQLFQERLCGVEWGAVMWKHRVQCVCLSLYTGPTALHGFPPSRVFRIFLRGLYFYFWLIRTSEKESWYFKIQCCLISTNRMHSL